MRLQLNIGSSFPKKSLGQNFITDKNFLLKLNNFVYATNKNIIIEIGPGKGALTNHLIKSKFKKLYLIEKDNDLAATLEEKYKMFKNITVINQDALLYDFNYFHKKRGVIIYGNLPFNISTKLLIKWIERDSWPSFFEKMILMFQKEVADRIIATHNTKKYGRLSVLVQSRCNVTKLLDAPASVFNPKPKVDGSLLLFEPIKDYSNIDFAKLGKLLELSFSSRRKKIRNTLEQYREILLDLKIDENLRPENLSVAEYCELVKSIH